MIPGDQFLRQAFADLRIGGVVALDDLELNIRRQIVFVELQVKIDCLLGLVARLRDKSGIAIDEPNLDGGLRCARRRS
jgi:hypothetical protein